MLASSLDGEHDPRSSHTLRSLCRGNRPIGDQAMKFLLRLSVPLILLDQLTKWLIQKNIPYGSEIPIIPGFFSLVHVSNTGAAFSLLQGNNLFFIVLGALALAVVFFLLVKGSVVDFLHFYIREYAWPSFNVADSCICIAAGLLILSSFRKQRPVTEN